MILQGADTGRVYSIGYIGSWVTREVPSGRYFVSARLEGKNTYTSESFQVAPGHTVSVSITKHGLTNRLDFKIDD